MRKEALQRQSVILASLTIGALGSDNRIVTLTKPRVGIERRGGSLRRANTLNNEVIRLYPFDEQSSRSSTSHPRFIGRPFCNGRVGKILTLSDCVASAQSCWLGLRPRGASGEPSVSGNRPLFIVASRFPRKECSLSQPLGWPIRFELWVGRGSRL